MRKVRGFTLVELLVVIGIIALLISILLPVLSRARESANRVSCAANLSALGKAAIQFAHEHNGLFPPAYQMPDAAYPYRFPVVVNRDEDLYGPRIAKWKTYGLPMQVWEKYGMHKKVWTCPSAVYCDVKEYDQNSVAPDEWGARGILWTHYMYVAGITNTNKGKSAQNWGRAVPAVKYNERGAAETVLAADMVYYSGGSSTKWDKVRPRYMINHTDSRNAIKPSFQNVLYADGHVVGKGPEFFPVALNTSNNWSLLHCGSGVGGYFYWDPTGANLVLNPPAPPKPPTTPPPPPTPKPPTPPAPPPILPTPIPQ